ncbi:polysaccharide deacetylase family protein [Paenibacillus sp. GYB003]|uniref:polysaccharide deacetylase family protein n=1 Tax=Paenibacillus sp. GYB003 TaxID=2994392 RepID=UPI002F964B91
MVGNVVKSRWQLRDYIAPLLAAAALLCAGCVPEDRELTAVSERSLTERIAAGTPATGKEPAAPKAAEPKPPAAGQDVPAAGSKNEHHVAIAGSASTVPATGAPAAESGSATEGAAADARGDAAASPAPASASVPASAPVPAADAEAAKEPKFSIPVLNYHSIGIEPDNNAVLDPKKLDAQMAHLKKEGYTALTLRQFTDIWDGRLKAPDKSVLLTFDDGYADNYTEAMPILRKYGYTAIMFVSPGMVGQDGYFADWEQIREMAEAGWDIQPHGMTHPYLSKLTVQEQRFEIAESIRQLKEQTGIDTVVFCYPYGVRNKDTIKLLEEHNVRFAFTIDQGRTERTQNPLLLKRIFVGGKESMETFVKKLKP